MDHALISRAWSRLVWLSARLPLAAVLALVALIYGAHVYLTFRYEYLNPFSIAEEWAHTNIAANNFLRFGFLNSFFLQDFSPSPYPEDHPFVYNHMPAGPDIVTALVLLLTGHDYQLTRFLFALAVLPGLYFYMRFVQLLVGQVSLGVAGLALFLVSPFVIISHLEAQIHSVFLLLGFGSLVWLIEHARGAAGWRLPAAVAALFFMSIYVQYVLVAGIVFALIFLWLLRVVELKLSHVLWGVGAVAAGVLLHLVQNLIYLGPELFKRELLYTLGNRTIGIPSKEELKDFYQSIFVVHHGSRTIDPVAFVRTMLGNLRPPQWQWLLLLLSLQGFLWWCLKRSGGMSSAMLTTFAQRFGRVFRLYAWAGLTIVLVLLIFPAFAQEVNLGPYGVNHLFLAIPGLALLVSTVALGSTMPADSERKHHVFKTILAVLLLISIFAPGWLVLFCGALIAAVAWAQSSRPTASSEALLTEPPRAFAVRVGLFLVGVFAVAALTRGTLNDARSLVAQVRYDRLLDGFSGLKKHGGKLFMTNINLPTVGFFANAPGYGVCELETIGAKGEVFSERCKVSYMRRHDYWRAQRPEYFFLFSNIRVFPGFTDCWPGISYLAGKVGSTDCVAELRSRLERNFERVERNELYEVYDLKKAIAHR